MADSKSILIVTGEVSGDLHGAHLLKYFKKLNPSVNAYAVGSHNLEAAGATMLADLTKRSTIGFIEPIRHIPYLLKVKKMLVKNIQEKKYDLVILIDYQGFNMLIAKESKKAGIRTVYYIPPQEWIWGSTKGLKKVVDSVSSVVAIFKEEYESYQNVTGKIGYFGHPLVSIINDFKDQANRGTKGEAIAIFPGSRKQEINVVFPRILEVMKEIQNQSPQLFVINLPNDHYKDHVQKELDQHGVKAVVEVGKSYEVLSQCRFMIATSGTISLEATILGVPHVVMYALSPISYWIAKNLMKIKLDYIALPNIVMKKTVVQEYLQIFRSEDIARYIVEILNDNNAYKELQSELDEVTQCLLVDGNLDILSNIAEYVLGEKIK